MSLFSSFKKLIVISLSAALSISLLALPSEANEYSCLQGPDTDGRDPIWTTSGEKDLKFIASWAFKDPEKCIVGMWSNPITGNNFTYPKGVNEKYSFPTSWTVTRSGEMVLVSAEVEFPLPLLKSLPHIDNSTSGLNFTQTKKDFKVSGHLKIKETDNFVTSYLTGEFGLAQLWGDWFSKNQGIFPSNCNAVKIKYNALELNSEINWKVLESGNNAKVEISITQDSNCIFLVHAGPLESIKSTSTGWCYFSLKTFAEYPFWCGPGSAYFSQILASPDQIIQIGLGEFAESKPSDYLNDGNTKVNYVPFQIISHKDSIVRNQEVVKVTTSIDTTILKNEFAENITLFVGFYSWHQDEGFRTSSGWRVTSSGNTWTARYSAGSSVSGGKNMRYQTRAIVIPIRDLIVSETEKAAAELKAKQEAEAKATAELKAKQEAEAKFEKIGSQQIGFCIGHNSAVKDLILRVNKLKANYPVKFSDFYKENYPGYSLTAASQKLLYSREELDCESFGQMSTPDNANSFKLKKEMWDSQLSSDLKYLSNVEREMLKVQDSTITCVKGKLTKKVTAVKPVCPKGYKKK